MLSQFTVLRNSTGSQNTVHTRYRYLAVTGPKTLFLPQDLNLLRTLLAVPRPQHLEASRRPRP
jgi:hypothetical protein